MLFIVAGLLQPGGYLQLQNRLRLLASPKLCACITEDTNIHFMIWFVLIKSRECLSVTNLTHILQSYHC